LEKGSNWAFVGMGILDFDKKMYVPTLTFLSAIHA
jgi:hypothetical protein